MRIGNDFFFCYVKVDRIIMETHFNVETKRNEKKWHQERFREDQAEAISIEIWFVSHIYSSHLIKQANQAHTFKLCIFAQSREN